MSEAASDVDEVEGKERSAGLWADAWRDLRRSPLFVTAGLVILLFAVVALVPGLFTKVDPRLCDGRNALLRPSAEHWFGTDLQGCDYYARTIYGARVSMIIGISVTAAAMIIAMVLGSLAGYYRGLWDTLISRATDIVLGVPLLLFALVLLNTVRNVVGERPLWSVVLVLVLLGWTTMTRLMRSKVLELRDADFVDAARTLGASDFRIITKHILPNAIAPVLVYATINVGVVIAAEATLSFLNVGLQLPAISWGLMINTAQTRVREAPHLLLFPGTFLSLTVLSFILMGDVLRDALDPKLR